MTYDPNIHRRRSIRLAGHDYTEPGEYFVTIVTQERASLFGDIAGYEMQTNDAGRMIQETWEEIPAYYPRIDIDEFVVMPNHVHGIIVIEAEDGERAPRGSALPHTLGGGKEVNSSEVSRDSPIKLSLGDVVERFKSLATTRYAAGVRERGWPRFTGKLWQRNYHEHIVRNEYSLRLIRAYIEGNPAMWAFDLENPENRW